FTIGPADAPPAARLRFKGLLFSEAFAGPEILHPTDADRQLLAQIGAAELVPAATRLIPANRLPSVIPPEKKPVHADPTTDAYCDGIQLLHRVQEIEHS